MELLADNALFSIEFSDYDAAIVAYALSAARVSKFNATFRALHFHFIKILLHFINRSTPT